MASFGINEPNAPNPFVGLFASGAVASGMGSYQPAVYTPPNCAGCGKRCAAVPFFPPRLIVVHGVSAEQSEWCMECAGFDLEKNRFTTREDWIRETVPDYLQKAPAGIIADWLQDQSRYKDSDYMRGLTSKSKSGGF